MVLMTMPQTPVSQKEHRYCLGTTIGPMARPSVNVAATGNNASVSKSASKIEEALLGTESNRVKLKKQYQYVRHSY
jgi:hypothetical protein